MICLKRDIRLLLKVCNSSVQKRHHKSRVKTGLFQLTWRRAAAEREAGAPSLLPPVNHLSPGLWGSQTSHCWLSSSELMSPDDKIFLLGGKVTVTEQSDEGTVYPGILGSFSTAQIKMSKWYVQCMPWYLPSYHLRKDRYNDGLTYWAIPVEYFYWYPALLLRQGPSGKSCSLLSHYLRCHNHRNKQQPTPTIASIHLTSARARGQTDWYQLVAGVGDILPNTSDLRPGVTDPRWCWAEMIHYSQICSLVWTTETCFKSIFSFSPPPPLLPPPLTW